jgi:DNA-binding transcriptional MerR regulator
MNKNAAALTLEEKTQENKDSRVLSTIKDVAKLLNVHQQTLRNWDRKNLIKPLRVGRTRVYTLQHIELCKKIKEYSGKGISLRGVKELLSKI